MILHFIFLFFGGMFFMNALPHLIAGMQGRPFPSPFANPPGKGDSLPTVNVIWAFVNLAIAYLLLIYLSHVELRDPAEAITVALGGFVISFFCARHFGQVNGNRR